MRRWNWVIVGLLAIITITTALMAQRSTAQEDDWTAYLTNPTTSDWLHVGADGTQTPLSLGLPEGATLVADGSTVAISADGSRIAYCTLTVGETNTTHLVIRDLTTSSDLYSTDFPSYAGCVLGDAAFTPDGERLWVGVSGDPSANQPAWQLVEIHVSDGLALATLDSNSPLAAEVESVAGPMVPYLFGSDNERVIFGVAGFGIVGPPTLPAYSWDGEGALVPVEGWGEPGADGLFASNEVVWPALDPNLPAGVPSDLLPAKNTVQYLDASGLQIPIYHSPEWVIRDVAWVNGGRQVAIALISPDDVSPTQVRWVLVNRDGIVQHFDPVEATRIALMDSRDGFAVLTAQLLATGEYHYTLTRYVGDTAQEIVALDDVADWQLKWVTPSIPAANLSPFIPFMIVPTAHSLPSATPTLGATSTPSHVAVTASFTPTPTLQQTVATTSSVRTATPIQPTNTSAAGQNRTPTRTPSPTNTRAPSTAVNTSVAPTATGGIRPPSSRTQTPTPTGSGSNSTATQIRPPASATLPILPASNTPRPSNTVAATTVRPTATSRAPGVAPTSTPRRGQLGGGSPTPITGPTTRPASNTPRPSSTFTPAPTNTRTPTFTPSRTPTRTPTRTPSMTFTPTRVVVPSKTPLPTTSGLPTKAPISGPTSTLSYGGNQTRLLITNMAGTDLCEIYFTPNTETTWGDNYLEDGAILANGATMVWIVEPAIYDVKVFDCFSNSLEEFGFDLTDGSMEILVSSSSMTGVPQ